MSEIWTAQKPDTCLVSEIQTSQFSDIDRTIFTATFRTLFGGSVGPNRKTFPDGSTQNHYEGVKVRQNPLPLRFMGAPSDQPPRVVVNQAVAPPNPPASPILTHLLHRKSPAPDPNNPQVGIFNLFLKKANFENKVYCIMLQ